MRVCKRCNVYTTDLFCEKCGGETTEDNNSQAYEERKAIEPKKKIEKKKIIPLVGAIVVCIMLFGGYKALKAHYTPLNAVKQYCTYLSSKSYQKAYEGLYNTDNDFMSEETFEGSLKDIDFSTYSIKEPTSGAVYQVQANGETYEIEVAEKGKKFLFFEDYKINADKLAIKDWNFNAPRGAEVYINDKKINKITKTPTTPRASQNLYNFQIDTYNVNNIFKGNYTITYKLAGADDVVMENSQAGNTIISPNFKMTKELKEQLTTQTKEFLKAYFKENGDYSSFISSNNDVETSMPTRTVTTKYYTFSGENMIIQESEITDSTHVKLKVMYEIASPMGNSPEGNGISKITTLSFVKENDKWLVCTASKY